MNSPFATAAMATGGRRWPGIPRRALAPPAKGTLKGMGVGIRHRRDPVAGGGLSHRLCPRGSTARSSRVHSRTGVLPHVDQLAAAEGREYGIVPEAVGDVLDRDVEEQQIGSLSDLERPG